MSNSKRQGPLVGLKVVEILSLGPGPFCAMMLADMGADVIQVCRADMVDFERSKEDPTNVATAGFTIHRSRRSMGVDLKSPEGIETTLRLVENADVLLEGYRPGVMEKLGLGPDVCLARNPGLVYGRVSGFGQTGPLAANPGHDINYIALSGLLDLVGPAGEPPSPPPGLLGDFGGAGMGLAFGVLAALFEKKNSGLGQVIDCSMVESSSILATLFHGMLQTNNYHLEHGTNSVDGGAHFYNAYQTKDGKWVSIAAVLPKFYKSMMDALGLSPTEPRQMDESQWPAQKQKLAEVFAQHTQAEWNEKLTGTDFCYTPVHNLATAPEHPQNRARDSFVDIEGMVQPAPAPKFSRTPGAVSAPPPEVGQHTADILADWGFSAREIDTLHQKGVVKTAVKSS
ncbi:MAG: CoA transferase [Gammaproteobacteria bacterium]|nr:CoA transferase [Gammaproteobacteria bacterium]